MSITQEISQALQDLSLPEKAAFYPYFFKTGKGQYGEGDQFIGVTVPDQRKVVKSYWDKIKLEELTYLLSSPIHEYRLTALLILVQKFEKAKSVDEKRLIVDYYLSKLEFVNNWDLVDSSCYKILGRYCYEINDDEVLRQLSFSDVMWEKRIAIVGTMFYIKKKKFDLTKEFAIRNLNHEHDLMHKANGWLLREMGKVDERELLDFLNIHYKKMPRTSLRYAIEKLDENLRQDYLKGNI